MDVCPLAVVNAPNVVLKGLREGEPFEEIHTKVLRDSFDDNITRKLRLASAIKGIFVDTTSREELDKFASRFFELFVEVNKTQKQG